MGCFEFERVIDLFVFLLLRGREHLLLCGGFFLSVYQSVDYACASNDIITILTQSPVHSNIRIDMSLKTTLIIRRKKPLNDIPTSKRPSSIFSPLTSNLDPGPASFQVPTVVSTAFRPSLVSSFVFRPQLST